MKKKFLSIILLFIFNTVAFFFFFHYENYNSLNYELFRNNKLIGYHNYEFERQNDFLKVKSVIEFKITKLNKD